MQVSVEDDGSYTYIQPGGNVTVEAVFKDGKLPASPKTGADSQLWLWLALLFVSGGLLFTLTVVAKSVKRKNNIIIYRKKSDE